MWIYKLVQYPVGVSSDVSSNIDNPSQEEIEYYWRSKT